jgi:hypothetical protein
VLVGSLAGQQPPLPTTVIRPGGATTGADFWNALGGQLRPSLDYSVRVSLAYGKAAYGPTVTTRIADVGPTATTQSADAGGVPGLQQPDRLIQIGGVITDDTKTAAAVPGAWVLLLDHGSQRQLAAVADDAGRFRFDRLVPGTVTIRAQAPGFFESSRTLSVPEPTGDYTLKLKAIP